MPDQLSQRLPISVWLTGTDSSSDSILLQPKTSDTGCPNNCRRRSVWKLCSNKRRIGIGEKTRGWEAESQWEWYGLSETGQAALIERSWNWINCPKRKGNGYANVSAQYTQAVSQQSIVLFCARICWHHHKERGISESPPLRMHFRPPAMYSGFLLKKSLQNGL